MNQKNVNLGIFAIKGKFQVEPNYAVLAIIALVEVIPLVALLDFTIITLG